MKYLIKLCSLLLIILALISSCTKIGVDKVADVNNVFDTKAAKLWYYGTFDGSSEFKENDYVKNGKKTPDWSKGNYRKVGNMEIMDFPLNKMQKSYPMYFMSNLTKVERQRIAAASLNKIVFIRNKTGQIFIRELAIIPIHKYAVAKNYDLSALNFAENFDFTGVIITKKWGGQILSNRKFENGRNKGSFIVKTKLEKYNSNNGNTNNAEDDCDFEEQCEEVLGEGFCEINENDQIVCTAGEWTTVCVSVYVCTPGDEPPPGDDCDYNSSESCECQLLGTGCGGGDDPPIDPPPPVECNYTSAQALAILNAITNEHDNTEGVTIVGQPSPPDANNIIRAPWSKYAYTTGFRILYSNLLSYRPTFSGVVFKSNQNSPWKFESFVFNDVIKVSGSLPLCFEDDIEKNVTTVISGDSLQGLYNGNFSITFRLNCIGVTSEHSTHTKPVNGSFNAGL